MEAVGMYSLDDEVTEPHSVSTDNFLILAAQAGNRSAFDALWARHSMKAFKMAYRIARNREDAEDAVQDAWLKAYMHLSTFDGRSTFSTWVMRIAINSALQILRRKRVRPEISVDCAHDDTSKHREIVDKRKNIEILYAERESAERLRKAITCLPPSLR